MATCRELVLDYVKDVTWRVNAEIGNDYKKVWKALLSCQSVLYTVVWMSFKGDTAMLVIYQSGYVGSSRHA